MMSQFVKVMRGAKWADFPYASILVHGDGPNDFGVSMTKEGRARCALAAALYRSRKAPFIIVSGGYAHPKQAAFSEASEMRSELIVAHGIPNAAILVDPHARATTTNVRNGARILINGRAPLDKPSLSVSSKWHIDTILSAQFTSRCKTEFGYMPAEYGKRINDMAVEFTPLSNR